MGKKEAIKVKDVAPMFISEESGQKVVEAMKKQTPMKLGDDPQWTHSCGSCLEELKIWMNYCPECGQKIDWED